MAKKLVSVRLDADDIQVIDDWSEKQRWYKRSDMVNAAFRLAAWLIKNGHSQELLRFWPKYDTVDEFTFKYHRKTS